MASRAAAFFFFFSFFLTFFLFGKKLSSGLSRFQLHRKIRENNPKQSCEFEIFTKHRENTGDLVC